MEDIGGSIGIVRRRELLGIAGVAQGRSRLIVEADGVDSLGQFEDNGGTRTKGQG